MSDKRCMNCLYYRDTVFQGTVHGGRCDYGGLSIPVDHYCGRWLPQEQTKEHSPDRFRELEARIAAIEAKLSPRAPLAYITPEGYVLVPLAVREKLGLLDGGGVAFTTNRETGYIEMLSDKQFYTLAGEEA